jgi:hypothetical protein
MNAATHKVEGNAKVPVLYMAPAVSGIPAPSTVTLSLAASTASRSSPYRPLRISSSASPVTNAPGSWVFAYLTQKPDTLRATEPDRQFTPDNQLSFACRDTAGVKCRPVGGVMVMAT